MDIVTVTKDNLEQEHICCAISNNKNCQVSSKKSWMQDRFEEGLVFKKGDVRGKVFIEYIPAEKAWCPIEAEDYMFIDCFWVSGQYKGKGISHLLLNECIEDSKNKEKSGLVVLSSTEKKPYLSDGNYLKYKGFLVADRIEPDYELLYLPFYEGSGVPQFKSCVKTPNIEEQGFVLYYCHQCPFTAKYVPIIEEMAKEKDIVFKSIRYETAQQAQNAPAPFTAYSLFYNGVFITNDILSVKKFEKLLEKLEL